MSPPKLTAAQARKLYDAEVERDDAKLAFDEADTELKKLRARYRSRVPLSEKAEDAAKGVREIVRAGIHIRITPAVSGESFSLSKYREAGGKITKTMRAAIGGKTPYDKWTVKGPAKTDDAAGSSR